jgi:uncharacterized protein YbaR (Trm112 family)
MSNPILIPNIEGVHWDVSALQYTIGLPEELSKRVYPVCPEDHTPMRFNSVSQYASMVTCPSCKSQYNFQPKTIPQIQLDITQKHAQLKNQKAEFLDIDGQLTPVTKPRRIKVDERFTIEVRVNRSRRGGHQVVVYVFDKEQKNKVQLLTDVDFQKLSFDQTNIDPRSILAKVEVTFKDGSKNSIKAE